MWRNGKRFPCPDCHKTFATQVDLKAHLMRHITQHPFVCFACGKGFKYDHTLDFHIKSQHGAENGSGNTGSATGSGSSSSSNSNSNNNNGSGVGGKSESLNLKSLNRKSSKLKREGLSEEVPGSVRGSNNSSNSSGTKNSSSSSNGVLNSRPSQGKSHQRLTLGAAIGATIEDSLRNSLGGSDDNNNNNDNDVCDEKLMGSLDGLNIPSDLHRRHLSPLQLAAASSMPVPGLGFGLLEPSILNGLKFPMGLSPYQGSLGSTTDGSSPISPSSKHQSSSILYPHLTGPVHSHGSAAAASLLLSAATTKVPSKTRTSSSPKFHSNYSPIPTPPLLLSKELSSGGSVSVSGGGSGSGSIKSLSKDATHLASLDGLHGLQGIASLSGSVGDVLSPRNLQMKSEKVLITVVEGVHPVSDQLYSLYKCCLCGFAFPSLEPVSIHVQSMHGSNLLNNSLSCDKCGATFKWKSELQLHEQLHKAMDQSLSSSTSSSTTTTSTTSTKGGTCSSSSSAAAAATPTTSSSSTTITSKCKSQLNQQQPQPQHLSHQHANQPQQQFHRALLQHHDQDQSRSFMMPPFLQPNLLFMNPYLNGVDQEAASKAHHSSSSSGSGEGESVVKRAKIKDEHEELGSRGSHNREEDDGQQGLNLCVKGKHGKSRETRDANNNNNNSTNCSGRSSASSNNSGSHNFMIRSDKHNGMNHDHENNINNSNSATGSSNHQHQHHNSMGMMDEPIDLKVESMSALASSLNTDPNNNPLNFLHSSLLPSTLGLTFPPSASSSAAAAATLAAAFAASISSQPSTHPGAQLLHQQQKSKHFHGLTGPSLTLESKCSSESIFENGSVVGHGNTNGSNGGNGIKVLEPVGDIEETAPGQFKCRYCEKTFDRIFSVHRHERVHTGYKPCICKNCGRGFSEKRNLRHHIIRFHSDGSGRELLKRVRKEKSSSSSSSTTKSDNRIHDNPNHPHLHQETSAMREDDNNNHNGNSNSNSNNLSPILNPHHNNYSGISDEMKQDSNDGDKSANNMFINNDDDNHCNRIGLSNNDNCNNNSNEDDGELEDEGNESDRHHRVAELSSSSRRRKSKPSKTISDQGGGDDEENGQESIDGRRGSGENCEVEEEESEVTDDHEAGGNRVPNGRIGESIMAGLDGDFDENDSIDTSRVPMMVSSRGDTDSGSPLQSSNTKDDLKCDVDQSSSRPASASPSSSSPCDVNQGSARSSGHGSFLSSYSPRLAVVDKGCKRGEPGRPEMGADGKYCFPCSYCEKTFCSSSDLDRHIGFHENVRPFKCDYCDYQSRTSSQLKVHMMRHAGIKQFLCHVCNYNGVTQSDLNRHWKTRSHRLRSANVCSTCSLGFSTASLLEDHESKFHGKEELRSGPFPGPLELSHVNLCSASSPSPPLGASRPPSVGSGASSSSPRSAGSGANVPVNRSNETGVGQNILGLNAKRFSVNNLLE